MNKEEPAAVSFAFDVFYDTGDDEEIEACIRDCGRIKTLCTQQIKDASVWTNFLRRNTTTTSESFGS